MLDKNYIKNLIGKTKDIVIVEIGSADSLDTKDFVEIFSDTDFKIYCVEPDKRNIEKFYRENFDANVSLFEGCVGNIDGEVDFYVSTKSKITGEDLIYSSSLRPPSDILYKIWHQFENAFVKSKINSIRLDTFVEERNIDHIDLLYMDVQGCEDIVIEGGKNTFDNKIKYIYTEYSNQEIYQGEPNLDKILELLPNYEVIKIFPNVTGDKLGGDILLSRKK